MAPLSPAVLLPVPLAAAVLPWAPKGLRDLPDLPAAYPSGVRVYGHHLQTMTGRFNALILSVGPFNCYSLKSGWGGEKTQNKPQNLSQMHEKPEITLASLSAITGGEHEQMFIGQALHFFFPLFFLMKSLFFSGLFC